MDPVPQVTVPTPQPVQMPQPPPPKKSNVLLWILLIFLLFGSGWGLYLTAREQGWLPTGISPTPAPTVALQPTPSPDPTVDWETYSNVDKGYSIKYPRSGFLRLICPDEELTVTNDGIGGQVSPVTMSTCARGGRYTLETKTYNSIQPEPEETDYYEITKKDILLDGVPAVQYIFDFTNIEVGPFPPWYTIARVNKDNKTYEIWFDEKDKLSLFDQILSTFKFSDEMTSKKSCQYNGVEYKDGENFDASDGCNRCFCSDGNVGCTLIACQ